jgi:hypothetical protein
MAYRIELCSNIQKVDTSNKRSVKTMMIMALMTALFFTAVAGAEEQVIDDETYFPQQMTTQQLLNACASSSMTNRGRKSLKFCEGFISGVEETLRLQSIKQPSNDSKLLCVHKGKSTRNFADIYIDYASKIKSLDAPAASFVMKTQQAAYPRQQ